MISIIIPAFNQNEMTTDCIISVIENTADYEIIVVDNGSDEPIVPPPDLWFDATVLGSKGKEYFPARDDIGKILVLRNEENLGFPVAVNQGVAASTGDVVVLLNNDVIVTPEWMDRILVHLETYSIVGPMTNYSAGIQRTTIPVYEDKESLYANALEYSKERDGLSVSVNWVTGFCFAFRRSLYDEVGKFDEEMWPTSGEEIDFCYRAKRAGHSVGVAKDVYVHHEGSVTFADLEMAGGPKYEDVCAETTEYLEKKHGAGFWKDQLAGVGSSNGLLRINLGCGRKQFQLTGFVNVDKDPSVTPDLVCDALDLPYGPESVDEIYCGHMLEHLDWREGENALHYWHGLLKPGGKISICVPDFDTLARGYLDDPSPARLRELNDSIIYSYKSRSPHKYAYNEALLREVMKAAGFDGLQRMPTDHRYFPLPVLWQVGIEGMKPCR